MMQTPETLKKAENQPTDNFRIVPAVIMIFLMLLFVGSTIYVLISSLL